MPPKPGGTLRAAFGLQVPGTAHPAVIRAARATRTPVFLPPVRFSRAFPPVAAAPLRVDGCHTIQRQQHWQRRRQLQLADPLGVATRPPAPSFRARLQARRSRRLPPIPDTPQSHGLTAPPQLRSHTAPGPASAHTAPQASSHPDYRSWCCRRGAVRLLVSVAVRSPSGFPQRHHVGRPATRHPHCARLLRCRCGSPAAEIPFSLWQPLRCASTVCHAHCYKLTLAARACARHTGSGTGLPHGVNWR